MEHLRTPLAKLVYDLANMLSTIKTPQNTYEVTNMESVLDRGDPVVVEKTGRRWLPCKLSTKCLSWSMGIDPLHWDHWALEHKGCGASYCLDCKGYSCGNQE